MLFQAHETLLNLGRNEQEYLAKKKVQHFLAGWKMLYRLVLLTRVKLNQSKTHKDHLFQEPLKLRQKMAPTILLFIAWWSTLLWSQCGMAASRSSSHFCGTIICMNYYSLEFQILFMYSTVCTCITTWQWKSFGLFVLLHVSLYTH